MSFLGKIQQKPKKTRVKIFLSTLVIFSVIIFFLWLLSVGSSISNISKKEDPNKPELPTISESISASLQDVFNKKGK